MDGLSNTLPAIFRPPPDDALDSYEPYVSPITADLIENYTIAAIKSTIQELITLGMVLRPTEIYHSLLFQIIPLGRALGFPDSTTDVFEYTRVIYAKPNSMHTPSMMLDAQRGKPFEVEVIIGEVMRMARSVGIEIPVSTLHFVCRHAERFIACRNPLCSFTRHPEPDIA